MEGLFLRWVQLSDDDFGDVFEEMLVAMNPRKTASSHSPKHVPDDDVHIRFECLGLNQWRGMHQSASIIIVIIIIKTVSVH